MQHVRRSMSRTDAGRGRARIVAMACAIVLLLPAAMANAQDAAGTGAVPGASPAAPAKAPVVTSRSDKKHGIETAAPRTDATAGTPAKAPVSTSRSNKKHGIAAGKADESQAGANPSQR